MVLSQLLLSNLWEKMGKTKNTTTSRQASAQAAADPGRGLERREPVLMGQGITWTGLAWEQVPVDVNQWPGWGHAVILPACRVLELFKVASELLTRDGDR